MYYRMANGFFADRINFRYFCNNPAPVLNQFSLPISGLAFRWAGSFNSFNTYAFRYAYSGYAMCIAGYVG